jgi:NADPH-dependent curcumin reductase CurA
VICGAISQYNNTTPVKGPSNYLSLLVNRASMTGMVVFDYNGRYALAAREMAGWIAEGKLKTREDIVLPSTLIKLLSSHHNLSTLPISLNLLTLSHFHLPSLHLISY